MKRLANDQLYKELRRLLDEGKILIGKIRVSDGENIYEYRALTECQPEHRDGYRHALATGRDAHIRDVMYAPIFMAAEHAKNIATLE